MTVARAHLPMPLCAASQARPSDSTRHLQRLSQRGTGEPVLEFLKSPLLRETTRPVGQIFSSVILSDDVFTVTLVIPQLSPLPYWSRNCWGYSNSGLMLFCSNERLIRD